MNPLHNKINLDQTTKQADNSISKRILKPIQRKPSIIGTNKVMVANRVTDCRTAFKQKVKRLPASKLLEGAQNTH